MEPNPHEMRIPSIKGMGNTVEPIYSNPHEIRTALDTFPKL